MLRRSCDDLSVFSHSALNYDNRASHLTNLDAVQLYRPGRLAGAKARHRPRLGVALVQQTGRQHLTATQHEDLHLQRSPSDQACTGHCPLR